MSLTSTITVKNNLRQALTYINATIVEGGWANGAQPPALIKANSITGPIILNPASGSGSSATLTYQIGNSGSQVVFTFTCAQYSDNIADWVTKQSLVGDATLFTPVTFNPGGPLSAIFQFDPST